MSISNSTAACFVGVIVEQSWGTGLYQSASLVPGNERNVRIMALVPDKANTLDGLQDCVFKTNLRVLYVAFANVCVRLAGGNEVSHESQHLTNKPRVDTLNSQKNHPHENKIK